ncbi:hypothetical protein, partial [Morganella morganii]|uniref:hypothetical protein n=1 Tax=Morganella morganii TaxID=582 RepID=UPI001BD9C3EB
RFFGGVGGTGTLSGFTAGGSGTFVFLTGVGGFTAGAALFFFGRGTASIRCFLRNTGCISVSLFFSVSAFGFRLRVRTGRGESAIL